MSPRSSDLNRARYAGRAAGLMEPSSVLISPRCPYTSAPMRAAWFRGLRRGRDERFKRVWIDPIRHAFESLVLAAEKFSTGCAGWRLCTKILKLDEDTYFSTFQRRNVLSERRWSVPKARAGAATLLADVASGDALVLCGSKVSAAFGLPYEALRTDVSSGRTMLIIPHPSGLNRQWAQPGLADRVRAAVMGLVQRCNPTESK